MTSPGVFTDIFQVLMVCVGVFVTLALSGVVAWEAWSRIWDELDRWKTFQFKESITRKIREMELWCGYDFPIMKDIQEYLAGYIHGPIIKDVGDFRDMLRKKYPKSKGGASE